MYKIKLLDNAIRDLKKLDNASAKRIAAKLEWLAGNINDTKLEILSGNLSNFFKLRVGDYRVLYELHQQNQMIIIHMIEHRSEVHKNK